MSTRTEIKRGSNWQGGRCLASNGYVLLYVGKDHPLSDVRGYAYEHRIVAQQTLGRDLLPEEEVHHKDGDRQNNHPENLEVVTRPVHRFLHRRYPNRLLRKPGEENPNVFCACGGERSLP